MKLIPSLRLLLTLSAAGLAADPAVDLTSLPPISRARPSTNDWLIQRVNRTAGFFRVEGKPEVALDNGLIRRTFRVTPNGATMGLDNLSTGAGLLRAVKPEALLTLNGQEHAIGGLAGQPDHAYLSPGWVDILRDQPEAFVLQGFTVGKPTAPFTWKRTRHGADLPWPPPGTAVDFAYHGRTESTRGISAIVHYEVYDGLPVLGKWLTVSNGTDRPLRLDRATTEVLAAVEAESPVDARPTNKWRLPPISVMSDYSFGGMDPVTSSRVTEWVSDPEYKTQVHYERQTPCLLLCRPPVGPGVTLAPGASWDSFRSWLVIHDSDSRERQGLALRKAQRTIAPWLTENPIMMHVRNADTKSFRLAVDQCAEVGFEMIIYTFGSGLDMENVDPAYLARIKADVDYAHAKGVQVGAYSLFSSRRVDDTNDVINPKTGKTGGAIFGNAPCLGSTWGEAYLVKLKRFIEATGLDLLEHDGPYPGDLCASKNHPGHRGLDDSQWTQWRESARLYGWCRERGVYVNAPDYYFFTGTSKTAMGYREDNWSLPRVQQLIHGRQNIFDGTFEKTPTMGWMFVPLTEYQGGGAAATLEPLSQHLPEYEAHLANNFGAGVQACYRGPRLYDTDATKELVRKWVSWFKEYRDILESDLVHLRRADGRDIDYILHVNPTLRRCGLAMIFNPLPEEVVRELKLPLYYTGLTTKAVVRGPDGRSKRYSLDRGYNIEVPIRVPANGCTWLVIQPP